MMAGPGDPQRCRLSIFCQNFARVQYRYFLDGGAFVPPPLVNVGLVTITPLIKPFIDVDFHTLEKIVTAIFNTKNKHLRNASLKMFPPSSMNRYARVDEMLEVRSILIRNSASFQRVIGT